MSRADVDLDRRDDQHRHAERLVPREAGTRGLVEGLRRARPLNNPPFVAFICVLSDSVTYAEARSP
jgi:hypothetical protein